jgi:non-specific serine/threonine protein kinase/serine/threonine-protein kinase
MRSRVKAHEPDVSNMDPDRWRRVDDLFHAALEREPQDRIAFLAKECAGDAGLLDQVGRLVEAHARASGFIETPVGAVMRSLVGEDEVAIGAQFGSYKVVGELGRGGMGTVYVAERADTQYEKRVAIKVVKRGMDTDAVLTQFRHERQILAGLEHPNIARLLDGGTTAGGLPYFVMEYIEGLPIDAYCDSHRLPITARLQLFRQVCAAVSHAHQHLVVHRDIKPSNILVTPGGTPKLLDFGIAKILHAGEPTETRGTVGALRLMTPEYASPEQVTGNQVTTASDVYALGLLLHELITGQRAHRLKTSSLDEVVRVVCDSEPARPSAVFAGLKDRDHVSATRGTPPEKLRKQLAGDLDQIVLAALRKEPQRRYASVAALAHDIHNYLDKRPVVARGEAWPYLARRFVRRNALPVTAVAGVFVALAAGLIATLWQARAAERARREAEVQRSQAERRFEDVRKLATSFVFEFHDAIAAGPTPARELVVSRGLQYLDSLAKDAERDRRLQLDLAEAYDRLSDIQGNPFGSNVGDVRASLESMKKATAIRELVSKGAQPQSAEGLALIRSLARLGDAYHATGRSKDAVDLYRRVVRAGGATLQAGGPGLDAQRSVAHASNRLCAILMTLGDSGGALDGCRNSVRLYEAFVRTDPGNATLREQAATAYSASANTLRLTGHFTEALPLSRRASDELKQLAATTSAPGRVRLQLATALTRQGNVEAALGLDADAVKSYDEAIDLLDDLLTADPSDQRIRTILSYLLLRQSPVLIRAGRSAAASASTRRGLAMLKTQAERPTAGPTDLNEYATWLLTCEPATERRPSEALRFARRAAESQAHPVYLDTLAMAYFQTGAVEQAVETAERALAMLPPLAPGSRPTGLRSEIEGHLAQFRRGSAPPRE